MDLSNSLPISNMNGSNLNKIKKVSCTTVNGKMIKNAAEANKSGEMGPFMREFSTITWPTVKVGSSTLVGMSTKGIGSMIKPKEKVFTCMLMGRCTLGNG